MADESEKETFSMATASKSLSSDSASLVDLKAEVFRKKEEALYNKVHGRNQANVAQNDSKKKNNIWSKSNVGVLKRSAEEAEKERKERIRIQMALEQKAEVYDKLKDGRYKDKDKLFLVNFDEEEEYNRRQEYSDEDDWVEYTDALGRTRKCHKSDLEDMKERDLEEYGEAGTSKSKSEQTMLSEDMRRDFLRQKWEKEEEENLRKTQLHYKDVLYDEARTHGAAFYNFSRNESDRLDEMENLANLHNETVIARANKDAKKANADAKLAARLKKVRDKKRLKMGLPILPDNEDPVNPFKEVIEETEEKSIETSVMDGLREMRQKAEENRMRNSIVREWDIGKEGVTAKEATDQEEFKEKLKLTMERKVLSQQEWVDQKRTERTNEFAPPSVYESINKLSNANRGGKKSNTNQNPSSSRQSYQNVPPPQSQNDFPENKSQPSPNRSQSDSFGFNQDMFHPSSNQNQNDSFAHPHGNMGSNRGANMNSGSRGQRGRGRGGQGRGGGPGHWNTPGPSEQTQRGAHGGMGPNRGRGGQGRGEGHSNRGSPGSIHHPQRGHRGSRGGMDSNRGRGGQGRGGGPGNWDSPGPSHQHQRGARGGMNPNRGSRGGPGQNFGSGGPSPYQKPQEVPGNMWGNQGPRNTPDESEDFDPDEPPPPGFAPRNKSNSSVSLQDRLQLHQSFNPKNITNEIHSAPSYYSSDDDDENDALEDTSKPKRAEIPPPSQMEYYSANKKTAPVKKGYRTGDQMAEAFLCGLQSSLKRKHQPEEPEESSDSD